MAFSQLEDPRCRRGVRHPFSGIVLLTMLGMLARIREMEVLVRWVYPTGILTSEPQYKVDYFLIQTRTTSRLAILAIVPFPRNEQTMPAQYRIRREQSADFRQCLSA